MDASEIIAIIKKRRDEFVESQAAGGPGDPLVHTAAEVSWFIANEYDSLLLEIQGRKLK